MRHCLSRVTLAFGLSLSAGIALAQAAPPPIESVKSKDEVLMYVMPDCGYCARAREHLRNSGVAWRELDIIASEQAAAEFHSKGGQGTPLIQIGEDRILGYDAGRLDAALAAHDLLAK